MAPKPHRATTLLALLAGLALLALLLAPRLESAGRARMIRAPAPLGPSDAQAPDPWAVPATLPASASRYARFETITRADGLPSNRVTTVLVEGETIHAGTDRGLAIRRGGTWSVVGAAEGLAHDYVTSLARDDAGGSLWVSTLQGLSRISGDKIRNYTARDSGLANDVVYHVVARDGLVWAATAAGTSCLDVRAGTWAIYDHENSIMHEPWCYALALAPGRAFVGVWGGGVVEREAASGRWREYRDPDGEMEIDLLRDDGPIHDVTSFVAYDAGVLWQSTYFGLSRYDGRRWRTYLKQDTGLPGDFLNHVAARGRTAWLASDEGFGVFDGVTCTTYRRRADGRCDVEVWRAGEPQERATLATAPAHNYILWIQAGANDVWLATGEGLSHGHAVAEEAR